MNLSLVEFRRGFEWVARELVLEPEHQEPVLQAVYQSLDLGRAKALKNLAAVWPEYARWPSGFAFLQDSTRQSLQEEGDWQEGDPLPEVTQRELLGLLLGRFQHVAHRLLRDQQVREFFEDEILKTRYKFLAVNRHLQPEDDHCGRGCNVVLPADEGLRQMEQLACPHPACRCTFDPVKKLV